MLSRHLYLIVYFVIIAFFISCNSSTDSNKPSTKTKQQLNQSKNDKIIKDLIIKYNAIHLNSHFDETGDFISLFTYKVQKFLNKNKDKVFLIEGTLADIIMEDTTYNIHLNGMFLFRDFRLIANLKENQFNLIHNKIKLNSYTNYAVIVKIRNIKTTLYSINAEGDSELIYDTPGLLIVYSDLLEIKQLH